MLYPFLLKYRHRLPVIMGLLILLIVASGLYMRYHFQTLRANFDSIYEDRLIPESEIYGISSQLFNRRLLLSEYLNDDPIEGVNKLKQDFFSNDNRIDSLVKLYETTLLVPSEKKSLEVFKNQLGNYRRIESQILRESKMTDRGHSRELFRHDASMCFHTMMNSLNQLSGIQTTVGKELKDVCDGEVAGLRQMAYFQIGLVLIIGLIIHFLSTPTATRHKGSKKYLLN